MAKICDRCKQPYPDNQDSCPHCGKSIAVSAIEVLDDDDIVDLIESDVLDEDFGKRTGVAPQSPSDDDLLHFAETEIHAGSAAVPPKAVEQSQQEASSVSPAAHAAGSSESQSAPDGKRSTAVHLPQAAGEQRSKVDTGLDLEVVGEESAGVAKRDAAPQIEVSSSEMDLGPVEPETHASPKVEPVYPDPEVSSSEIDLDAVEVEATAEPAEDIMDVIEEKADDQLDVVELADAESDSGLTRKEVISAQPASPGVLDTFVPTPASDAKVLKDLELVDSSSAVNLGAAPSGTGDRPSGRDLIAEAVESGVDLGKHKQKAAGDSDALHLGEKPAAGDADASDSSSVNLGGPISHKGVAPSSGSAAVAAASSEEVHSGFHMSELEHADSPSSDIDIDALLDSGDSTAEAHPAAALHDDSLVELDASSKSYAEIQSAVISAGATEEETEPTSAVTPAKTLTVEKPRNARSWLGGGVVGVILGGVGCWLALWLFGAEPSQQSVPENTRTSKETPQGTRAAPTLGDVLEHARTGDFANAMAVLEEPGEEPERLEARGMLRSVQYIRELKKNKKPDDKQKDDATADLTKANTAEALFWLGYLKEHAGDVDGAVKTYKEGLERFPKDKVRFQTALDRLEKPAAPSARLPGSWPREYSDDESRLLALVLSVLLADAPDADSDAEEAGVDFWKAVKLARNQQYDEALKLLDKARATHDRQRFARLRKAQNPISDPTEEIFLKTCEEMRTFWEIRKKLKESGYDIAKVGDVKAVETVLADKDLADKKSMMADDKLKAVQTELEALGFKGQDLKGLKEFFASMKPPDEKLKDLIGKLEANGFKDPDIAKNVEQLLEARKMSEDKLKKVGDKLEAAGIKEEDANKGLDTLLEANKGATDKLKEVAGKLEAAGVKEDDPVKGVEQLADLRQKAESMVSDMAKKLAAAQSAAPKKDTGERTTAPKRDTGDRTTIPPVRRPESPLVANPAGAEEHFAAGLRHYFAGRYADAEREFAAAVQNEGRDGRYYYFLGLSRLPLAKRSEAYEDFAEGARLEKQNRPAGAAVSAALERVQGPERALLNRFRQ